MAGGNAHNKVKRERPRTSSLLFAGRPKEEHMNSVNSLTQPLLRYELDQSVSQQHNDGRRKLGTFFGVLVPCVLCMFSAILYLRLVNIFPRTVRGWNLLPQNITDLEDPKQFKSAALRILRLDD
ncbi:hypothetical protein HOLleu_38391 [Holothuria leucospilota]|uniref:Uncharacterized protein n=1 Tax=Holothuria leucospilota TaxID=206669 RepID=A0A9Q1BC53_HOLLE|nr:hypothetical protein HOLleu_38391 [Holothuria leucospilota]